MPHRPMRLAGVVPIVVLVALAGTCFARLAAHPSQLIVDDLFPSIDRANPGEPRPVGNDLTFLFLPHHLSIMRVISRFGHLPLWDARGFAGRPMVGNPQSGMFYPPVWAVWWSGTPSALGWLTVGHLFWGGLGVYVLMRSTGRGQWAAAVAAAVYQASPFLLAHTFEGHYPHVWAACWYPWAFWAYSQMRSDQPRGLLFLPIILALSYLTGHPQEWLLLLLALSVWSLSDVLNAWRAQGTRRAAVKLLAWTGVVIFSIGLTAVEVVPHLAVRPWLLGTQSLPTRFEIPRRYHLHPLNAFQLLSPDALGGPSTYFGDDNYWETLFAIGLAPLVLGVIAALRHPDRKLVRGWLVLAGLAVWFAGGRHLGFFSLVYSVVPGMNGFRVPARSLFLANLAGAVLAGLGVETLRIRITEPFAWRKFALRRAGIMFVVVVGLLGIARGLDVVGQWRGFEAARRILSDGCLWLTLGGIGAVLVVGCLLPSRSSHLASALFGLVAIAELGWQGYSHLPVAPVARFVGDDLVGETLLRLAGDSPRHGPLRIKARDSCYADLPAVDRGFEKTNINDVFQLAHAAALYETLYPVASRPRRRRDQPMNDAVDDFRRQVRQAVFDRMSVAFLVSDCVESDPGWPVAAELRGRQHAFFVIERNPTALPRAYVVGSAAVGPNDAESALGHFRDHDPRASVLMSDDPLRSLPPGRRQRFIAAAWASTDPDHPVLEVTTEAPGLLVVTDSWLPGWTARVDGVVTPVLRGNYAQRVIPLMQPGRHTIALDYQPPGFDLGCAITALSTLGWVLLCVCIRWRGRQRASSQLERERINSPHWRSSQPVSLLASRA